MKAFTPNLPPGAHLAPFFVLNNRLDADHLTTMINECAEAGFHAVILHPRPGLRTPYLSKSWFAAIGHCLEAAKRVGLKVWLYDEFPYPSGAAGGRVIQRNSEFAEKHLSVTRFSLKGGGVVTQALGNAVILEAFLLPAGTRGGVPLKEAKLVTSSVGMRNTTWISSYEWDSRYYYSSEHALLYGCPRSGDYLPEQVFEDELPPGDWWLIVFSSTTGGDFLEPFGHYVDLSNRDATAAFLDETHERYRDHFGERFGSEILGVFTDEPKYRNAMPWSRFIAGAWNAYQKDPRALLALLPEAEDEKTLSSFRRVTSDLFHDHWIVPNRDWCANHKLGLIGHISPEEDWWDECRCAGSILRHLREFSIPGCDVIIPAVGDRSHPVLNLTPSLAVSAAAQSGATHALCEVFGCSDYSLDMQTVKRISDWLMVSGINFIVPHGCFYSLAGLRRYDAPPTFLSPSTLQPFLAEWSAHVVETARSLGPTSTADLVIVRPMSWLFGLSDQRRDEAKAVFQEALDLVENLLEKGLSFHWVDDADLLTAEVRGERIHIGKACYRTMVHWHNLASPEVTAWLEKREIRALSPTKAMGVEGPLHCPEGDVRVARNSRGEWFCVNLTSSPRRFCIAGHAANLSGYESRWISAPEVARSLPRHVSLKGDWKIRVPRENTLRMMTWTCNGEPRLPGSGYDPRVLSSSSTSTTVFGPVPNSPALPVPRHLVYEGEFVWKGSEGDLTLCFEAGMVEGAWTCFCNDHPLQDWHPRKDAFGGHQHRITEFLRGGTNKIRLEVRAEDARDGLWLEPVLRGNFQVGRSGGLERSEPEIMGDDWSRCGYPSYSGSMDFERTLDWDAEAADEEIDLVFTIPPAGMVEVFVNERPQGSLLWSPWRLLLRDGLRSGTNVIRLRVTNTLHNFVSGQDRPSGILGGVEIQSGVGASGSAKEDQRLPRLDREEVHA